MRVGGEGWRMDRGNTDTQKGMKGEKEGERKGERGRERERASTCWTKVGKGPGEITHENESLHQTDEGGKRPKRG